MHRIGSFFPHHEIFFDLRCRRTESPEIFVENTLFTQSGLGVSPDNTVVVQSLRGKLAGQRSYIGANQTVIQGKDEIFNKVQEQGTTYYRYYAIADNDKEKIYIYTKGDANKNIDNYIVEKRYVIGNVKFKIPYIGLPTVWLNEL